METQEKISFHDLLALYPFEGPANQVVSEPPIDKLPISDRNQLKSRMQACSGDALEPFLLTLKESGTAQALSQGNTDPHRPKTVALRRAPVSETTVDDDVPLKFSISKDWKTLDNGKDLVKAKFVLSRNDDEVGEMVAIIDGDTFDLDHRIVEAKYRDQGMGNMLLNAEEAFVQRSATKDQRVKKQIVETGQLDVMCWMWNNGYRPSTPEDAEKFEKVLAGDSTIRRGLRNYIYSESTPTEKRNGEFENWPMAIGITFAKDFVPGISTEIEQTRSATGLAAKQISID